MTKRSVYDKLLYALKSNANVAQLVEQLIRNQQVMGSSPIISSKGSVSPGFFRRCSSMVEYQLPKLTTRVRFPSSAPKMKVASAAFFLLANVIVISGKYYITAQAFSQ